MAGYLAEQAVTQFASAKHVVLAGAKPPVLFFAYPDRPSDLVLEGARVHTLANRAHDVVGALEALADLVAADTKPVLRNRFVANYPKGLPPLL